MGEEQVGPLSALTSVRINRVEFRENVETCSRDKAGFDGSVYIAAQCAGHPSVLISNPDLQNVFPSHEIYTVDLS